MVTPGYRSGAQPSVWRPASLQELQIMKMQLAETWCYAAGGTLLRTQWETEQNVPPEHLISLDCIPDIRGITMQRDEIVIGAMTRLKECAADPLLRQLPILQDAVLSIAAPSVRNAATIGGNIASGIGDTLPALLVYDAKLQWLTDCGTEVQSVSSWLQGGCDGSRHSDNVLLSVHIPYDVVRDNLTPYKSAHETAEGKREISFYRKLGRREVFTASLVTVAFNGEIDPGNERWIRIGIAAGGGSGAAVRLTETEQWLQSGRADAAQASGLAARAAAEFSSYTDAFAAESFRKQAAGNMLGAGLWQGFQS